MAHALLSLGSNLGRSAWLLEQARSRLAALPELTLLRSSRIWRTRAVGGPAEQPDFLNQALLVETTLGPEGLLRAALECEKALGRTRASRWSARTLDVDLLLYEQQVRDTPELQLPHPRMSFRRFVLHPAVEIAPRMRHPVADRSLLELLRHLEHAPPAVWIVSEALWAALPAADESSAVDKSPADLPGANAEQTGPLAPGGQVVSLGEILLHRASTPEQMARLNQTSRAERPGSAGYPQWVAWVGPELPPGGAPPRLVVAGRFVGEEPGGDSSSTSWQEAIRQVGPHLVLRFRDGGHLAEELAAALAASQGDSILGPCS